MYSACATLKTDRQKLELKMTSTEWKLIETRKNLAGRNIGKRILIGTLCRCNEVKAQLEASPCAGSDKYKVEPYNPKGETR